MSTQWKRRRMSWCDYEHVVDFANPLKMLCSGGCSPHMRSTALWALPTTLSLDGILVSTWTSFPKWSPQSMSDGITRVLVKILTHGSHTKCPASAPLLEGPRILLLKLLSWLFCALDHWSSVMWPLYFSNRSNDVPTFTVHWRRAFRVATIAWLPSLPSSSTHSHTNLREVGQGLERGFLCSQQGNACLSPLLGQPSFSLCMLSLCLCSLSHTHIHAYMSHIFISPGNDTDNL